MTCNIFVFLFAVTILLLLLRVILSKTGLVYLARRFSRSIEDAVHVYQFFRIPQYNHDMQENQLYRQAHAYLTSLAATEDSDFSNVFIGRNSKDFVLVPDPNHAVDDFFLGARISWIYDSKVRDNCSRTLILKIKKSDKCKVLRPYLQHIRTLSDEAEQRRRDLKLHIIADKATCHRQNGRWLSLPFTHPATLDTIVMEPDLKHKVKLDLEVFVKAKQYYNRLGRVWKRNYLIYGPSGTGKSSFVAAMANFLCYDVYDVDLSRVSDDSELKSLLLETTRRSVIVVEDFDRFMIHKPSSVTLTGVLNFMDGILNSCCTEERIMVFIVHDKEHIDPTILRPGRVDVHIQFPLCDFSAFKTLASSYLGLKDHKLFPEVEGMFDKGSSLSPAEIGELMLSNRNSPTRALRSILVALKTEGDRRGCPSVKYRFLDSNSMKFVEDPGDESHLFSREGANIVKDFKKLYGKFRLRSNRKSPSYDIISTQTKSDWVGES